MNVIVFVLFTSFMVRDLEVVLNASYRIIMVVFFFSMFVPTDLAYTPKWYQKKYKKNSATTTGWPIRLIQIQICLIYLVTVLIKVHSDEWYFGTAFFNALNNTNFAVFDGTWMIHYPWLVNFMTYASLFVELLFPFFIWFKRTRIPTLFGVIVLHVIVLFTMNVLWFSEVMLATFVLFLDTSEYSLLENWLVTLYGKVVSYLPKVARA